MYTEEEINAAIARVETAKQNNPVGWAFLDTLGLDPANSYVFYAFENSRAHAHRLGIEDNPVLLYTAAWLNGLAVGHALGKGG